MSGKLHGERRRSGRLAVRGSAAVRGTLTLGRDGRLRGRLGGRMVGTRVRLRWGG